MASARARRTRTSGSAASSTSPSRQRRPTGRSPSRTAQSSSLRHGPASVGATMSASEVIVQLPMRSSSSRPVSGSKIVATIGTSRSRWRTRSAARNGQASSLDTTSAASAPASERVAQLLVRRVGESGHLGARGPQRLRGLLGDVAVAQEQDPARRHGSAPYRHVSGGDVERPDSRAAIGDRRPCRGTLVARRPAGTSALDPQPRAAARRRRVRHQARPRQVSRRDPASRPAPGGRSGSPCATRGRA